MAGEEASRQTPWQVRNYQPEDLHALYLLDRSCFRPGIAYNKLELETFLRHPYCRCRLAEMPDGMVAGFAIVEVRPRTRHLTGHLITIDVAEAARRQGLGSLLMQEMELLARSLGAVRMQLEVAADDAGAQTFYARHGYRTTGRLRGYYMGKLDGLSMEKLLA